MPGERRIWLPLAVGMSCYSLGFVVYAALMIAHGHVASPSAADPFWLALYPGAYVTIALLVRRRVVALDAGLWLDGVVAALATTALGAAFAFRPVVDAATGGSISVATKLAYPLGDVVLLALVGGAVVLTGCRPARTWLLLGGGLVVFGIGDVDYVEHAVDGGTGDRRRVGGRPPDARGRGVGAAARGGCRGAARDAAARARRPVRGRRGRAARRRVAAGSAPRRPRSRRRRCSARSCGWRIAVALEGRLEVTRAQALTDDLTQLGNRRLLVEDLDRAVAVASPDTPAALVLFDLNGFKHYNDTFGHLEGDRLLAQLARRLEDAVSDRGTAYRLGGDEFCALVAGDPRELDGLLPKLEAALGEAHDAGTVGCSYGVALDPARGADGE